MDPRATYESRTELQILDVREPAEWAEGHIDGTVHIPMNQVPERMHEVDPERTVVAICRSGHRSGRVAAYLRGRGISAPNMPGGLQRWEKEGLPITRRRDAS